MLLPRRWQARLAGAVKDVHAPAARRPAQQRLRGWDQSVSIRKTATRGAAAAKPAGAENPVRTGQAA
jgi:hypothetical protein